MEGYVFGTGKENKFTVQTKQIETVTVGIRSPLL